MRILIASVLFALSVLVGGAAVASPGPPATAWVLAGHADLIVVARVDAVLPINCLEEFCREDSEAHLTVQETWKGEHLDSLIVPYASRLACPEPARYEVGERVVAALALDARSQWRTVSHSDGTLHPTDEELPVLRRLMQEAIRLHADGGGTPEEKLDWHVRAASHPATRSHGVHPLLVSWTARRGSPPPAHAGRRGLPPMTAEHHARLAEALLRDPPAIHGEDLSRQLAMTRALLVLLEDHEDAELDATVAELIENVLALDDPPASVVLLMVAALERLGDESAQLRYRRTRGDRLRLDADGARAFWKQSLELLARRDGPPPHASDAPTESRATSAPR